MDPIDTEIKNKRIIEEELALLKAKNKLPSRTQRKSDLSINADNVYKIARRAIKSRENVSQKPKNKPSVLPKHKKEEVIQKLDEIRSEKGNYFEKREKRKQTEENRKKEATGFIKKLKLEKRQREKRQLKPAKIDDNYVQQLEDMMEQRRLKEVSPLLIPI